jgi:hypothetical protein
LARTDVHSYGQFDTGAALQNQRQQRQDVPQQNTPLTSSVAGCSLAIATAGLMSGHQQALLSLIANVVVYPYGFVPEDELV